MAIKGKNRKRAKSKAPALPPKPVVSARKTPLPLRRDVKRAVVVTLSVLALLGGMRLCQNVSRSDDLKAYDIKVTTAQSIFVNHFNPNVPGSVDTSVQAFTGGTMKAADFLKLTETWEKDFQSASVAVAKIKPINKTVEEAQFLMQQGIDGYQRVVRLWNLAAQVKQLADAETDKTKKKALNDKVQVIMLQADDIRKGQADGSYKRGVEILTDLNVEWGLQKKQSDQQQQQQQQVPQ